MFQIAIEMGDTDGEEVIGAGALNPVGGDGGISFSELCDDAIIHIFQYFTVIERTRWERVHSRLHELLPAITENLDSFRIPYHNHQTTREEERTFLNVLKRSPKVRRLSFDQLRQEQLICDILDGIDTVETFTERLITSCPNCEEIRFNVYPSSGFGLSAANCFVAGLGPDNQIKKIALQIDFGMHCAMRELGERLTSLTSKCSRLRDMSLTMYGPFQLPEELEAPSKAREETRESFEKMWDDIRVKLVRMDISYNDAELFFGTSHWTCKQFTNLQQLVPPELSGGFIRNISENCPQLRSLTIKAKEMWTLKYLLELRHLEQLTWSYFDEESDERREENLVTMTEFLKANGRQLTKLDLRIPVQDARFFNCIRRYCTKMKNLSLVLDGTLRKGFDPIETVAGLTGLRKLNLGCCKLDVQDIEEILQRSHKLKKFKFYVPIFERANVPAIKQLFLDYAKRWPKRKITVKLRYCGGNYYTEYEKEVVDNLHLNIDDGCNMTDYWDDDNED